MICYAARVGSEPVTVVSFLLSLAAIIIAVLSWREAWRANRRADRVEVNLEVGEVKTAASVYDDLGPDDVSAEAAVTVRLVGTGLASNVRVVVVYPKSGETREVHKYARLGGGAERTVQAELFADPLDVAEVLVRWADVDGVHETPRQRIKHPRGRGGLVKD